MRILLLMLAELVRVLLRVERKLDWVMEVLAKDKKPIDLPLTMMASQSTCPLCKQKVRYHPTRVDDICEFPVRKCGCVPPNTEMVETVSLNEETKT